MENDSRSANTRGVGSGCGASVPPMPPKSPSTFFKNKAFTTIMESPSETAPANDDSDNDSDSDEGAATHQVNVRTPLQGPRPSGTSNPGSRRLHTSPIRSSRPGSGGGGTAHTVPVPPLPAVTDTGGAGAALVARVVPSTQTRRLRVPDSVGDDTRSPATMATASQPSARARRGEEVTIARHVAMAVVRGSFHGPSR